MRPLKIRDFGLLWFGMTISLLGDGMYFVAIAWLVLRISNAPTALAIVGVAWTLPQVVFLLWAGVVSDRFDRRKVMIAADILRAGAIGLIGVLAVSDAVRLWHVVILVAVYGAGEGFFMPAFSAIVPEVVPKDQLIQANSLDQFMRPVTLRFAGPALGGFIIGVFGIGTAFFLDAVTFIFSAVAIAGMRPSQLVDGSNEADRDAIREMKEGFAYVRRHAWLWLSLLAAAVGLLAFYGPFQVLVPFLVKNSLNGSAGDLGLVFAVGGMGAILASVLMSQRGLPRRHITFTYLCWAAGTLTLIGYALASALWEVMIVTFVMEVLLTAGMIVWTALLQGKVPGRLLGRVSSLDWLVSSSLIPLSYALTGPLAERAGLKTTFVAAGLFGGGAITLFLLAPRLHDVEREDAAPPVTA
ncbi:MAG: MFS transporter [Actinomycetota bacterium]|nr:MFS transporter [Actinomycetota bacterium]